MIKYYCIASRLNNKDFLILKQDDHYGPGPFCYASVEEAKEFFLPLYNTLSTEPVSSENYTLGLKQLALTQPVIIAINEDIIQDELAKWREGTLLYTSEEQIVPVPHLICPMKSGFIDQYLELDILRDIEGITRIGPDGSIQVSSFMINHNYNEKEHTIDPITEEKAKEILRKRGLI